MKRILIVIFCVFALSLAGAAQTAAAAKKPAMKKIAAGPVPDKISIQKIWDGWSTLDPSNTAKYYATGPHTFFDIAPLKYNSWEEYSNGAKALVSNFKSAKFEVNDDLAIHPSGELVWATATIKEEMTETSGKVDMGNFRWTVVFENIDGKWLIVHEHVSAPIQ